ncbi:MAG: rhamnogalacturonan acetylesterase [Breznakibacter sp.]
MRRILNVFILFVAAAYTLHAQKTLKFDFGQGKVKKGYIGVTPETIYTPGRGYGFDYGTCPASEAVRCKGALTGDYCTSTHPFYFSVDLPEGNYDVTVTLGQRNGSSLTTVKAESRRLMLEKVRTPKGKMVTRTFTVNVRTPRINDSVSIRIKPREKAYLNWDKKLTIEFCDSLPGIAAMEIVPNQAAVTVFLAGNSTVVDQDKEPWAAWGQMITRFFEPGRVVVANYAESGESLSSFVSSKRLDKIMSVVKPGDYLFIEFGHNDQKQKGEGIGPWESYSNYLRNFVLEARNLGVIPVIVTSMHRRNFDAEGKVVNTLGDYPAAARKVAGELKVPLIDLNQMSQTLYEAWGPEKSVKGFVHYPAGTWPGQTEKLEDNTHFSPYGAYQIAQCIVKGIRDLNLDLAQFIISGLPPFDPAHPQDPDSWDLPLSPMAANEKPDGN